MERRGDGGLIHPTYQKHHRLHAGDGSTLLQQTIVAIEAATASLVIITADGIDRRCVSIPIAVLS